MVRYLIALVAAAALAPAPAAAQPQSAREQARRAAAAPMHGYSQIRRDERQQAARDPQLMRELAQLVSEGAPASPQVDPASVLWWLADAGGPEHLPLFVRFSSEPPESPVFQTAVYGLARHAAQPQAAARLRALARGDVGREGLNQIAVVLMYVGDAPARTALRDLPDRQLSPMIRTAVSRFLASPLGEAGRWPCVAGEAFIPGADGRYGCRPNPQRPEL